MYLKPLLQQLDGMLNPDLVQVRIEVLACVAFEHFAKIAAVIVEELRQRFQLNILAVMAFYEIRHLLHNRGAVRLADLVSQIPQADTQLSKQLVVMMSEEEGSNHRQILLYRNLRIACGRFI
ncbi:hypothetical protein D3C78_1333110 [compost metagenome]